MTGPDPEPGVESPWQAPLRPEVAPTDFLLQWSTGTRPEPPEPPRPPRRSFLPVRDLTKQGVHQVLGFVEARRLTAILDASKVQETMTPDGPRPMLRHRHWAGLAVRLAGAVLALVGAIWINPALLALIVLAAAHGLLITLRRSTHKYWGAGIGGSEFVTGWLLAMWLGDGFLRAGLIIGTLFTIVLTVMAWQVDMEFVTEDGQLVRTRGLFLLKRTVQAPLSAIRIASVTGPFLGLGLVTVDTTSDNDQLLHNFGLIAQPNDWSAMLLRAARRPAAPVPVNSA